MNINLTTLIPGPRHGQMDATLHGDLSTIIEWTADLSYCCISIRPSSVFC